MKNEVRDDLYITLNDSRSKVDLGVASSADYGNNSPLYARNGIRPQIRHRVWLDKKKKPTE